MNDLAKKIDTASGSFVPLSFDRPVDFSKGTNDVNRQMQMQWFRRKRQALLQV
jgi:hypothetical protein